MKRYQQLYRYILVDEFQDTSSLQYQIIRMLGARYRNVCVVGDPDQTIYSWRQAELRNTDNFRKDFPGTRVIGMDENYRSSKTIVAAANALISRNSLRREKKLTTSREKGSPWLSQGLKMRVMRRSISPGGSRSSWRNAASRIPTSPFFTAPTRSPGRLRTVSARKASPTNCPAAPRSTSARRSRIWWPGCA